MSSVFRERTKDFEIDFQIRIIRILPVSSQEQLVDFSNKDLHRKPFTFLASKLNLMDIYQGSSCGGC